MKKLTPWIILAIVIGFELFAFNAMAQTPIKVPPEFTAPQEQASELAVPQTPEAAPSSIMAIVYCNKISGLAVIDKEGTIHLVGLEGLSKSDVIKIMQSVPADRVKAANLGCPGNPSKDTTVL